MSWASKLFSPAIVGRAWVPRRQAREHVDGLAWLAVLRRVVPAYGGVIYQETTVHAVEITGRVSDAGLPPHTLAGLHSLKVGAPRRRRTVTV